MRFRSHDVLVKSTELTMNRMSIFTRQSSVPHCFLPLFRLFVSITFLLVCLAPALGYTHSQRITNLPKELTPWVDWVLEEKEYLNCYVNQFEAGNSLAERQCVWANAAVIQLNGDSIEFSTDWILDRSGFVPLMGDSSSWPSNVKVNGAPAIVVSRKNNGRSIPGVWLTKGTYEINGSIAFSSNLNSLKINSGFAKIEVFQEGKRIPYSQTDDFELRFNTLQVDKQPMRVSTIVERLLSQDSHWTLSTFIDITIAESAGEVVIGPLFPEQFSLVKSHLIKSEDNSAIRFVIDKERLLRTTLLPGTYRLTLEAVANRQQMQFEPASHTYHWPESEIWAFRKNSLYGDIDFSSGQRVDPELASLIDIEKGYSFFRVDATSPIHMAQRNTANLTTSAQFILNRNLWLSFDHENLTFEDKLTGIHFAGNRLETLPTVDLLSAKTDSSDIFVNKLPDGHSGIEWREQNIEVTGLGKMDWIDGALLVSGWNQIFSQVNTTLYLPPATKLITVVGADDVTNDWLGEWDLWSIFICLFMCVLFFKTFGWRVGLVSSVTLLLCYHELSLPLIFINGMLAIVLQKHLPFSAQHIVVKCYSLVSLLGFALCCVLFFRHQVLISVYPQLEKSIVQRVELSDSVSRSYQSAGQAVMSTMKRGVSHQPSMSKQQAYDQEIERAEITGSKIARQRLVFDEGVVQAGISRPDWSWHKHSITWNSPVTSDQTFTLIMLSGVELLIIRIIGFFFLFLLLWMTCRDLLSDAPAQLKKTGWQRDLSSIVPCVLVLFSYAYAQPSYADVPPDSVLAELEQRLTKPDACRPDCSVLSTLTLAVDKRSFIAEVQVDVASATAVTLFNLKGIEITSARLNGNALTRMFRNSAGYLVVALPPGIHHVVLKARIVPKVSFSLEFVRPPKQITVKSDAWSTFGLGDKGVMKSSSLQFQANQSMIDTTNEQATMNNKVQIESLSSQPFILLYRHVIVDSEVRVLTEAVRIAPEHGVLTLPVRLLPQEDVVSNVPSEDRQVPVFLDSHESLFSWSGNLTLNDGSLVLSAMDNPAVVEVWSINTSLRWHTEELDLFSRWQQQSNLALEEGEAFYLPKLGETLTLNLSRLESFNDAVAVVDDAVLRLNPGLKVSQGKLSYLVRSPRGVEQELILPKDVKVKSVSINHVLQRIRQEDQLLSLALDSGLSEVDIDFESSRLSFPLYHIPEFDLGLPSSNLTVQVSNYPAWLLYSQGPLVGIAVLYWGQLLIFLGLAFVFGNRHGLPIRRWQWIVFGLGLSVTSWLPLWMLIVFCGGLLAFQRGSFLLDTRAKFDMARYALSVLGIVILIGLIVIIPSSLFSYPDMAIAGNGSTSTQWRWFVDRSSGVTPQITLFSVSFIFYKVFLVIWSLWLSFALLSWVRSSWSIIFRSPVPEFMMSSNKTEEDKTKKEDKHKESDDGES